VRHLVSVVPVTEGVVYFFSQTKPLPTAQTSAEGTPKKKTPLSSVQTIANAKVVAAGVPATRQLEFDDEHAERWMEMLLGS
jgi:hypothetical protein